MSRLAEGSEFQMKEDKCLICLAEEILEVLGNKEIFITDVEKVVSVLEKNEYKVR